MQTVEELGVDISHLDERQVDRTQGIIRVAPIAPRVAPRSARQHTLIVGTILRVDRQFDLRAGIRDRRRATDIERHDETRERQRGRSSDLERSFALGLGALHKLITERERHIEQLHTSEDVVILVTDRTAQAVETRCRRSLQLNFIALRQCRCAEDIAVQIALLGRERMVDTLRAGTDERHLGRGRILLELDICTSVVTHSHNLVVGILDSLRTEQVVGEEVDRLAQHLRAHLQFIVIDNVQTAILDRIQTLHKAAVATCNGRVIVRKEVDIAQSIDRIVVHNRLTLIVIARQRLAHYDRHVGLIVTDRSIDLIENIVDRKIEVATIAQHRADSRAFLIQHREVQHIALV